LNLIIDIGNTCVKLALFKRGELHHLEISPEEPLDSVKSMLKRFPEIKYAIVSSVREKATDIQAYLNRQDRLCCLVDENLPIPLENCYETPKTLGYDRLAACVGAYFKNKNTNILVIDAGTAITFDFVNENAEYEGGCISPGLNMRYKALHHFTKKLPLLEVSGDFQPIGKNTNEAITGGVQNGLVFEVDAYINKLKEQHSNLKVVLTGGDASFIKEHIQNEVETNPEILVIGLNTILEFNLLTLL
jgi:type III pantothenate kinase